MSKIADSNVTRFKTRTALMIATSFSVLAVVGCSSGPNQEEDSPQVKAELAASDETRAAFEISKWQVLAADQGGSRFVGHDSEGRSRAEFLVVPKEETSVQVKVLSPETGLFRVDADGNIEPGADSRLKALVAALYHDTGSAGARPSTATTTDRDIGTLGEELSLAYQGKEEYWGGFWGYRANYNVAGWCPNHGLRSHYEAYSGQNTCSVNRWTTQVAADCTMNLHIGIAAFNSDICYWNVYQNP